MNREVWVFGASKEMPEFNSVVREKIQLFVNSWNTHGESIVPEIEFLENRFIKVTSNHKLGLVSGCSKDALFKFIQELGDLFGLDFLSRGLVYIKDNTDAVSSFNFNELSSIDVTNEDLTVFDLTIKDEKEFLEKWNLRISDSWIAQIPR